MPMVEYGNLVVGAAVVLALIALFSVMAWKYWHGQWLRSIAGNTFATDDELQAPVQKRMGKRIAAVMLLYVFSLLLLLVATVAKEFGGVDFLGAAEVFAVAVMVGSAAWACVATWRDKANARKADPKRPSGATDAEMDRRAMIVLGVVFAIYLIICLVVAPLAAKA